MCGLRDNPVGNKTVKNVENCQMYKEEWQQKTKRENSYE